MKKKFLLLIIVFLIFAVNIHAGAESQYLITDIKVEGNKEIKTASIIKELGIEKGQFYNSAEIGAGSQKVFDMGYFIRVQPFLEAADVGVRLILEVDELPVVKGVEIKGNSFFEEEEILEMIAPLEGSVINVNQLQEIERKIEDHYIENNILAVRAAWDFGQDGMLYCEINEGRLNKIVIEGTEKTRDYVILREIDLDKGDLIDIEKIEEGLMRVLELGYFREINPQQLELVDEENDLYNLLINFDEDSKTGNFVPGFTWSSEQGFAGKIDIEETNVGGNGQRLSFRGVFGDSPYYSLTFSEPWILGYPYTFGFNLYKNKLLGDDEELGEFIEKNNGGYFSLGKDFENNWRGKAVLKFKNSSNEWIEAGESEEGSTRSFELHAYHQNQNDLFLATEGYNDTFAVKYAGSILGGDYDFSKYELDLRRYFSGFKDDHSLQLRLNTAWINGNAPGFEECTLGGPYNLRAYETGSLRGEARILTSFEYHISVVERINALLFLDAGNTWDSTQDIDLGDMRFSYGPGVRLNTPLGLIRLDCAFDENGIPKTQFSMGYSF